ncbi:MAG: UDP-N-acetylmuramate--L-alanine ligase [Saprospiraceae bacterium]|nr:UDP-N-acetylmuramate--L-alanine ligase [Saprospiraceae bacterium]
MKTIYFIGIGGIGMSALARYHQRRGATIYGYDRTETPLTRALASEGMHIHYTDDVHLIPDQVDMVVYTPAVPASHSELQWFRANGYPVYKRAEVLGLISREKRALAVAGTHGKTTTSSLVAHLLRAGGVDATAFVGGLALNLGGNYAEGNSEWVVVEADEFDRSFLHLHPEVAILNSIDPDHLDIYGTPEALRDAYARFAGQVSPDGLLLMQADIDLPKAGNVKTFGIEKGDYRAQNLHVEDGWMVFDLQTPALLFDGLRMAFPGIYNVSNATAAIAAALYAGAPADQIAPALAAYKGVHRRFEFILRTASVVFIDDYAHHPAELESVIQAIRALYPNRRLTGVFQPHLFSRTRDFVEGFAAALDKLDSALLLDIYPAREEPIPGVDSQMILDRMTLTDRSLVSKAALTTEIAQRRPELLVTLGAGDIDALVQPLSETLKKAML